MSVDQIVGEASCSKRMLYHYYGSKDGLYLRQEFRKLEDCELEVASKERSVAEELNDILERYFNSLKATPTFVKLLMWENLNRGEFLDQHPSLLCKGPILGRLEGVLAEGKASGEVRTDADAKHLLVLLIGVCFIYFSNHYTLQHTLGLDLSDDSELDAGLKLAQDVVVRGLMIS